MNRQQYIRRNEDGSTDIMVEVAEHIYVNVLYEGVKQTARVAFVHRGKVYHGRVKNKWRAPASTRSRTPLFYIGPVLWKQLTAPPLKRTDDPMAQDINIATRALEERNWSLLLAIFGVRPASLARRLEAKVAAQRYWWDVCPRTRLDVRQAADYAAGIARGFASPFPLPCRGGTFEAHDLDQWAKDSGPDRKRLGRRPYVRTDTTERQDWLAAFMSRRWKTAELYGPTWFEKQRWCVFNGGKPLYLGGRHGDLECPEGLRCANGWPFYRMRQHEQLAPGDARWNEDLYSAGYRYLTDWHLRLCRDDRRKSYGAARKALGTFEAVIEPIVCQDAPAGSLTHLSRYHNRTKAIDEIMARLREGLRLLGEHYAIVPRPLTIEKITARRAAEYRYLDMERGQQIIEAGRMHVEQGREISSNQLSIGNQSFGVQENTNNINGRGTKSGQYEILGIGNDENSSPPVQSLNPPSAPVGRQAPHYFARPLVMPTDERTNRCRSR